MTPTIRNATPADEASIVSIYEAALDEPSELNLVRNLLSDDGVIPELSLIAELDGGPVGHLLGMRARIEGAENVGEVPLVAAVAVRPEKQDRGIGAALVRDVLAKARERGNRLAVALGPPPFYAPMGFVPCSRLGVQPPHQIFGQAFMAVELAENAAEGASGRLLPPAAFEPYSS